VINAHEFDFRPLASLALDKDAQDTQPLAVNAGMEFRSYER
jgi:hypothetical protein